MAETFSPNFGLSEFDQDDVPPTYTAAKANTNIEKIDAILASVMRFKAAFSGTLQTGQDVLIIKERPPMGYTYAALRLRVLLQTAPTGQSAIFTFYKNGASIGTVTITAGNKYGETVLGGAVSFTDADDATYAITQVGSIVAGATATFYMEAA